MDHLHLEERQHFPKLMIKDASLFYQTNSNITFTNAIKHQINTIHNIPIHSKTYRNPYIHKDEVKRQIQEMLEGGVIRPSKSPYSAPIWIVPKKMTLVGKKSGD